MLFGIIEMNHKAKKHFGQNFLVDQNVIADIVRATIIWFCGP